MDHMEAGILFLDDDIKLIESYKEIFSNYFKVYATNSPENAINIINSYKIGVVVCDYFMPKMSGIEFLTLLLDTNPLIRRILISGRMDVNIAMESIDISKAHKILVKPFIVTEFAEELISQLRIYKTRMKYDQQSTKLKQEISSPYDLFELQTNELISMIYEYSQNNNTTDYSDGLGEILNLVFNDSKLFLDQYQKDLIGNTMSLKYIKQNLDYFDLITNMHNQSYLVAYTLVARTYLELLEENLTRARSIYRRFTNYIHIHNLIDEIPLKGYFNRLSMILDEKLNQTPTLTGKKTRERIIELTNLFEYNIKEKLDLNINFNDGFVDITNYFSILIMKDKSVVFFKNKLPNIDLKHLCISIDTLQNLSLDIYPGEEIFHTVDFKGGSIQISLFDSIKYVLISSDSSIHTRLKLNKFIIDSLDLIKTIPILTLTNDEDVEHINNIAKELFDI